MIQLWPPKKTKKTIQIVPLTLQLCIKIIQKNCNKEIQLVFELLELKLVVTGEEKIVGSESIIIQLFMGSKKAKKIWSGETPNLKSGQGSMNTRPAKICTSFLLSICAQFFSHAIKDGAKFTTSPKFPQKLSNQKLPQHTGQVILLEKAQVGIQNVMWVVCIVGNDTITFIQICKKSSQG